MELYKREVCSSRAYRSDDAYRSGFDAGSRRVAGVGVELFAFCRTRLGGVEVPVG